MSKQLVLIVVENEQQARDIVSVLIEGEEEGQLDFPFGCSIHEAGDAFNPLDLEVM